MHSHKGLPFRCCQDVKPPKINKPKVNSFNSFRCCIFFNPPPIHSELCSNQIFDPVIFSILIFCVVPSVHLLQVVLTQCGIGHSWLTDEYLLKRKPRPESNGCQFPLKLKFHLHGMRYVNTGCLSCSKFVK